MKPLEKMKLIFFETLEKETEVEREAYLNEACRDDPSLRPEIDALLKGHFRADSFLKSSTLDPNVSLENISLSEAPGTVIGRYKLLEKIGEGGMAVVYMAEQTEPIRRKVALKIIKLGMDTKSVIARFEAERQALALMDHPNIAKVLDAGATETGRPYFVMELVKGVSITEYCDKNALSTKERLELFIQVCNAVQHAHQKGIIHRDIKPSNVMVTHHDGKPVPKVIDFGIAKAINQKLTEKTLFTRYAHIIGTPAYMSPEQAELSDLDINTRTDIYSLGVLLYELLTGTTPFGEEELRKAGYIEMQRVIREQEPVKPSTKLSTLGGTLTDIAKHRNSTPDLLKKALRGDLDWIVMKSLEKDRARRYETANGLAQDVTRHIEHEPVLARGPSTTYRLQKFLRRHRSHAIGALAIAVVVVSVAVILSMWNQNRLQLAEAEKFQHQAILSQAREQYAKADREAALETIKPILDSRHVGPEAQLLYAGILVDNRRSGEAVAVLGGLLDKRPEIAGAAHSLLARILWESASPNAIVGATLCGCPIHRPALSEVEGAATRGRPYDAIEDHRQKAEALLPETAEAYFLRAMTALTVKEQFAALDKALQLDPDHYESLRLRAFIFYASRKYEEMKEEARAMTVLHRNDPLGHSLRAIALREFGRYAEAIMEYDRAIDRTAKDSPQYIDLAAQRCGTFLQMGDYERVVLEAQAYLKLWPNQSVFQYPLFSAWTALGEYDKAVTLFRQIIDPGHEARRQFGEWCAKYVFDTLVAGRSWHGAGPVPTGAAFLPMVEAEETYRSLSAKAHRLTTDGFSASWSPDEKKLAFSAGVLGYSGVAVYDLATKETELLIFPGKDPRWSPDGKYIVFVRDCQFLRISQFIALEPQDQRRLRVDEEVWVMKADGTQPRHLAQGGSPSWSQDSTCVYYHSRVDSALCSISIEEQDAKPKQIMKCSHEFPAISPDQKRVAYIEGAQLRVKDLTSQSVIAEWPILPTMWGGVAWSPTGRELCLGGAADQIGLWIYSLGKPQPARVLTGQIGRGLWSDDRTKLAFRLGSGCSEIWAADLDPNVSTVEALGPGQTPDEHVQEMVAFYSRRIEADPQDAYAYSSRAQYYDCLHDRDNAAADMRCWSAILSGRNLRVAMPSNIARTIKGPFDCQFVFSAERPVNEIPLVNVAFGQKGRCNMKLFKIPMAVTSLVGLCFLAGLDAPPARADFTFGEPADLDVAMLFFPNSNVSVAGFSSDGLEMFVGSDHAGGQGSFDLWVLKRASPEDDWGPPENLGPIVNSAGFEAAASISADGLELYLISSRPGGYGGNDMYVTRRATRTSPWGPPTTLGPKVNSPYAEPGLSVSSDGLELYFSSGRGPGGLGGTDLYVSMRATTQDPWGDPANLGPAVNSPFWEQVPFLSPDGLLLFFASGRPGGYGDNDIWMTRRASHAAPWELVVNLGPIINSPKFDFGPCLAPDGSALYFFRDRGDGSVWTCWKAPILPIVDFNGDGIVDIADVFIMLEHWHTNYSLCDIGPMPWGDGFVDAQDLVVLAEHMANNPTDVNDPNGL